MTFPTNIFPGAPLSSDQLERRAVAKTIRNALNALEKHTKANPYYYSTNLIDVAQLVVSTLEESQFNTSQLSARIVLRQLIRQPKFTALINALKLKSDNWTLVSKEGDIYQVHEVEKPGGLYLERINITEQVAADASLKADAELVAKSAVLTGGIVSSNERLPLANWLQFHQLNLPGTIDQAQNLIAFLELTLPSAPAHGNYWGVSRETGETALSIDDNQHSNIYQTTYKLMNKGDLRPEPLINYLTKALLKDKTPTFLREYPDLSWTLLIETDEAKAFAQSCFEALNLPHPANASPMSAEQRSRLLVAALMLDFALGRADKNQSFLEDYIYHPNLVHANAYEIRQALEQMLISRRVNEAAAPLALQLILAGLAPECLIRTPFTLQIGTPGWVMLRKSVLLAESIAPGLSRQMSYEELLELGAIAPTSAQQQTLHDWATLQGIRDWATLNELNPDNVNDLPTQEIIKQAATRYNEHIDVIGTALKTISSPPVSRRKLAKAELHETGCPPMTQIALPFDRRNRSYYYSVLDIYMTRNLLRGREYDTRTGESIYKKYPDLTELEPINAIYTTKVKEHFAQYQSAISTILRMALSRLPMEDRLVIEYSKLAIYHVRNTRPLSGLGSHNPPRHASNTGSFGVVILCRYGTQINCYELFPLKGVCRSNPKLAQAYTEGFTLDSNGWYSVGPNGNNDDFKSLTFLHDAVVDINAYFKGTELNYDGEIKGVMLERFAEFESQSDARPFSRSPLQSFNSERFNKIGEMTAEHNPPTSYDQFYATSYDKTDLQQRLDDNDQIVDTILNIIIPFKQCIEGLSSGDPDRRSGALFSCVMDLTAILFVFAGAVGPFSKALASSSKLLNLSKVGAQFVLSVFNPLDGVPQLIQGGAKLVGKGVMRLSHFGHSVTRAGAGQLRALTSTSGSYDLVKALSKTGAASEIRMTLPTVAHGRALFQDDTIETASQILTRLTDKNIPLPKTASPAELEHLFNNAVIDTTRKLQKAQELEVLIGKTALDDLLTTVLSKNGLDYSAARSASNGYFDLLETVSEIEARKVNYMKSHQQNLLKQDLGTAPYNGVLPESHYNVHGFTDNAQRAGAWIVHASNSPGNDLDSIVAILREYAASNKALTDPDVIRQLHVSIAPATSDIVRVGVSDKKYASSISGFAVMQDHLKTLDTAHEHFSKQLLGTVVGFHGFGDGNGRTGRALYAISEIRRNRFNPLSKEAFSALHGLD